MTQPETPLKEDLKRLAEHKMTRFDVHYDDEVRRIAQQALWAIEAAEAALSAVRTTPQTREPNG